MAVLRVGTPARGIFEADADPTAPDPPSALYVRRHFLDTGWLPAAADGIPDPYRPGKTVAHYHCADIKLELPQTGNVYQTDPEWRRTAPLSAVLFEEISEDPAGLLFVSATTVRVHVQAHNRSRTSTGVQVWTLYAKAGAGLPALDATLSGTPFNFWSQFTAAGTIVPALPGDSYWKAVGPPRILSAVDASHPRVASWDWVVPLRRKNQRPLYCFVTFLHGASSPIGETTRADVDELTVTNRQIGLKNVARLPPLTKYRPKHRPKPKRPVHPKWSATTAARSAAYVEFHNASAETREIDLVIDARGLPPALDLSFQVTKHEMRQPLNAAVKGARPVGARQGRSVSDREYPRRDIVGIPQRATAERPLPELPPSAFHDAVYRAGEEKYIEIRGVRLPPRGRGALVVSLLNTGVLEPGARFIVEVFQRAAGAHTETPLLKGVRCVVQVIDDRPRVVERDGPLEDEGPRPDDE
jgi:hypothetical protein